MSKSKEEIEEILEYVIKLIDKQIPKKPIERHYEDPGEEPYIKHTCPAGCRVTLHGGRYGVKYCPRCGQAIDWSE